MTDFKTAVLAMAKARPDSPVSLIVDLALALESSVDTDAVPDLDNAEALAAWAARQPEVTHYVQQDMKIHAIKELRSLTGSNLKQAKLAIDVLMPPAPYQY